MSKPKIIELIEANPDLPIVAFVHEEVVGGDEYCWWMGKWSDADIREYYVGRERVHIKGYDDEEEVLSDLADCESYCDPNGKDITELSDAEWDDLYKSVPWVKAIFVWITV